MTAMLKQFKIIDNNTSEVKARGVIYPSGKTEYETIEASPDIVVSKNILAVKEKAKAKGQEVVMCEEHEMLREYYFQRNEDVSGQSGCGTVVRGIVFPSGFASHEWIASDAQSVNMYDNAKQAERIHGHGGKTVMKFVDKDGLPEIE